MGLNGCQLSGSEIAFGANPDTNRIRKAVSLCLKGPEVFARRATVTLQRGHERQLEKFIAREELRRGERRLDLRQPDRAALFEGFDGDLLPFAGFADGLFLIELRHHPFREQRHDARSAQLRGLLDNGLHDFSFRDGLEQGHAAEPGRQGILFGDAEADFVAIVFLHFAKELMAGAIKHAHALAARDPKHVQRMMRLAAGQKQSWPLALIGRQEKAVHRSAHWNRLLAFSKNDWRSGLSLPSQSSANS